MDIRDGTVADIDFVRQLISDLGVSRNDVVTTGFVEVAVPSIDELKEWVADNPFFLIACVDGEPIGFFLGFTDAMTQQWEGEDEILKHLEANYEEFVYADVMGFVVEHQHKGHATELFDALFDRVDEEGYSDVFGAVAHAPLCNLASQKLFMKVGFDLLEEFTDSHGLTFGIYKKIVEGF